MPHRHDSYCIIINHTTRSLFVQFFIPSHPFLLFFLSCFYFLFSSVIRPSRPIFYLYLLMIFWYTILSVRRGFLLSWIHGKTRKYQAYKCITLQFSTKYAYVPIERVLMLCSTLNIDNENNQSSEEVRDKFGISFFLKKKKLIIFFVIIVLFSTSYIY